MKHLFLIFLAGLLATQQAQAFETDSFKTPLGELQVTFVGHGSLLLKLGRQVIAVDPFSKAGDYSKLEKADIVVVTHEHPDHLDRVAIKAISQGKTLFIAPEAAVVRDLMPRVQVLANGQITVLGKLQVEAVPAYNLVQKRPDGQLFHPKGRGNGYVFNYGGFKVYIAGDTENVPEMAALKGVDVAFLPMNLPYTMTPEMVLSAVRLLQPKILYPYHTGETKLEDLSKLMKSERGTELRIRPMK